MLRKIITSLLALCLISVGTVSYVNAESTQLFKVPNIKQSDQWKVELDGVKYYSEMDRPEKGKFEMYSLKITNIGKDLKNVSFDSFRDEPNTQTKFGLSISDEEHEVFKHGMEFNFSNFPISVKSNELQIEISWHDDPVTLTNGKKVQGREYKETFSFTRN